MTNIRYAEVLAVQENVRVPDWHPPTRPPMIQKVQVLDWQPPLKIRVLGSHVEIEDLMLSLRISCLD